VIPCGLVVVTTKDAPPSAELYLVVAVAAKIYVPPVEIATEQS